MTFRLRSLLDAPERDRVLHPRYAGLYVLGAVLLVPWTIFLFITLPDRNVSHWWSVTWGGFDVMLVIVFVGCAYRILRLSPLTAVVCAAAAALLVTDAWFDITLAGTRDDLIGAVLLAVLVELPMAALCVRTSMRVMRVFDQARPYLRAAGFRVVGGRLVPPADWPFGEQQVEPPVDMHPEGT